MRQKKQKSPGQAMKGGGDNNDPGQTVNNMEAPEIQTKHDDVTTMNSVKQ